MTYCVVLRSYGRGVVPNQTSPLLHQAREVVFQVFHELRGDGRAGHGDALRERAKDGQMARICAMRTTIERRLVTEMMIQSSQIGEPLGIGGAGTATRLLDSSCAQHDFSATDAALHQRLQIRHDSSIKALFPVA